jgi:hypothetical protein
MLVWSLPRLRDLSGGLDPFDLRFFGYDSAAARALLAALGPAGRSFYLTVQQGLDTAFPALLAMTLALAYALLAPPTAARVLTLIAVAAAALDYMGAPPGGGGPRGGRGGAPAGAPDPGTPVYGPPPPAGPVDIERVRLMLDPTQAVVEGDRLVQPLPDGSKAVLSLRPEAQEKLQALFDKYDVPVGAVVAIEAATGRVVTTRPSARITAKPRRSVSV